EDLLGAILECPPPPLDMRLGQTAKPEPSPKLVVGQVRRLQDCLKLLLGAPVLRASLTLLLALVVHVRDVTRRSQPARQRRLRHPRLAAERGGPRPAGTPHA